LSTGIITKSLIICMTATTKGEIYVGTSEDGLLKSTDQGMTWAVANENLGRATITDVIAAPNGDIYGICTQGSGLGIGILFKPYQANIWFDGNDGLLDPDQNTALAFAPDGSAYTAIKNRGVWRSQPIVNAVEPTANNSNDLSIHITPNPATSKAIISYSLPERSFVKLELCDQLGRTLQIFSSERQGKGEHSLNVDFDGIGSGVYFVRLTTPNGNAVEKIVINK
ncbi:MAG: T9SS type A sorting domain-containing protein, partial [Ignavibacteriota bacterium]